ncbi:hypothetical protein CPB83DRAFT_801313 [Crepidotus variabilis]|uniref:Uncharacterized protein n=1 Tax=Crepidotus variabilis TaxID=179855 RepID=A0A9P6E2Y1_9AGAR|nr:hypothetical protein CPB83DRAFT_801313 [Crepidotus variabilis]
MLYDPTTAPQLKPWLVRTLEPICDAEPGALADYILALLKHNVPENEMRKELASQLEEFLEKECSNFIDTLFKALRTKTYMPYASGTDSPPLQVTPLDGGSNSTEGGIPIPLDGLLSTSASGSGSSSQPRSRKRSNSAQDDDARPHKGPRLAHGHSHEGQFGGYGGGGHQGVGPEQWQMMNMGMGMGMNPYGMPMGGMPMHNGHGNGRWNQGYQPPDQKRGICRDYHNKGFCARGEMCKFSHGEDAVVPGQLFPGGPPAMQMPFMPMFPSGLPFMQGPGSIPSAGATGAGGAYDPHDPRGSRQHQRAPLLPRIQGEAGSVVHPTASNASGELPVIQDLTPSSSKAQHGQNQSNVQPLPSGDVAMGGMAGYDPIMAMVAAASASYQQQQQPMEGVDGASMHNNGAVAPGMRPPSGRGSFRGRGRGRGGNNAGPSANGTFPNADTQTFRPTKRSDKTLVVEKIPDDKLYLEQVNEWFKRFGTVTNVAIDKAGAKALVSFAEHEEAHQAWRSEEAVFGNRFVKVFWHRPMEGHGSVGARMLKASEGAIKELGQGRNETNSRTAPPSSGGGPSDAPKAPTAPKKQSAATTALALKQQLLEQKINEQKTLMEELGKASGDEKKEIMAKLRGLGEEMKTLTTPSTPTSGAAQSPSKEKGKEKLETDLDIKNGAGGEEVSSSSSTTEDLKAKLERLKAEAASLGLDSALGASSAPPTYRGGYRGRPPRGRGGYYRGGPAMRGGPPRASMKLDNRPKKLFVKGVSDEHAQALRDWYETTGQLESMEPSMETGTPTAYIATFKSRSAAEQGLAKGSNIPIVGTVQISWYTGKDGGSRTGAAASTTSTAKVEANGVDARSVDGDNSRRSPGAESVLEEEEVVSGWGVDGDDGDGMGML